MTVTSSYRRFEPDAEGWAQCSEGGHAAVSDEVFLANIRENLQLDLPYLKKVAPHRLTMLFLGGGPTLAQFADEIRERAKQPDIQIFTSNKTHDWALENGIVPHGQVIFDAKPKMAEYCTKPHPDVTYFIGLQCDPSVYRALEGHRVVRMFVPCRLGMKPRNGEDDESEDERGLDEKLVLDALPDAAWVSGGTMAPLRAMVLAHILGFQKCEFYGFDSCYGPDGEKYAYEKDRVEDIYEAKCADGRIFVTSDTLSNQARQFVKWTERLAGLVEFKVHGDNLTAHNWKLYLADKERLRAKWGDALITDEYRQLNARLHDERPDYGASGKRYAHIVTSLAGQLIARYGPITVLDYGCGKQTLAQALPGLNIKGYDPCIEGLDQAPEPADLVVCTDVLEHIEPKLLANVLDDLKRVTKKLILLGIATQPAEKTLPDGRNAHLIVRNENWWLQKLRPRFTIIEEARSPTGLICVGQAKEIR